MITNSDNSVKVISPLEETGSIPVSVQDQTSESVDLYLFRTDAEPVLTSAISEDDKVFNINTNANISANDAITILEGGSVFQAVVVSTTATTVTVSFPCDKDFTTAAAVKVGPWNMAVDGSETAQEFSIEAAANSEVDVYSMRVSALDDLSMDSTTFCGIVNGITNGLIIRHVNGSAKNLAYVVNNLGFREQGYSIEFMPANKHSEYGMIAEKNYPITNGNVIRLYGSESDKLTAIIQDDLSSQSMLNISISGHTVTN